MTIKLITSFVLAFLFVSAFGKYYVPWLRRQKAGQQIKSQVDWHKSKAGTPTMGGVMFILGAILVCLTVGADGMLHGRFEHIFVLLFACVFGLIGFLDDWEKLKKKENMGLSSRSKFLLQLAAALVFILLMRQIGFVHPHLYVPFSHRVVYMPEWLYLVFRRVRHRRHGQRRQHHRRGGRPCHRNEPAGVPVLRGGLHRLGQTLSGARHLRLRHGGRAAAAFCFYNFNPAKCFMGDTGSLFLGGAIAALAFAYDMPLILITLGFVFIIETLSDIIQVGYFKLTHGKRVFKMAPFHHHLEMGGWTGKKWKEKELFFLFTGISLVMAIISFIGVYQRYPY